MSKRTDPRKGWRGRLLNPYSAVSKYPTWRPHLEGIDLLMYKVYRDLYLKWKFLSGPTWSITSMKLVLLLSLQCDDSKEFSPCHDEVYMWEGDDDWITTFLKYLMSRQPSFEHLHFIMAFFPNTYLAASYKMEYDYRGYPMPEWDLSWQERIAQRAKEEIALKERFDKERKPTEAALRLVIHLALHGDALHEGLLCHATPEEQWNHDWIRSQAERLMDLYPHPENYRFILEYFPKTYLAVEAYSKLHYDE